MIYFYCVLTDRTNSHFTALNTPSIVPVIIPYVHKVYNIYLILHDLIAH